MTLVESGNENTYPEGDAVNYQQRLQELFTPSAELVAEQRPRAWAAAQKVIALLVNTGQQEAVQTYAGIVDWRLFGKPGDQLPSGLSMYRQEDGTIAIDRDLSHKYLTHGLTETIDSSLGRLGLSAVSKALYDEQRNNIARRNGEELEVITRLLEQTAEYQLLASFDRPERHPSKTPLNQYWMQVRQSQIEQDVRQRFGYSEGEIILPGSQARHEMQRQIFHLDDETMIQPDSSNSHKQGLQRAKAYLMPFIREAYEHDDYVIGNGLTFVDVRFKDRELSIIYRDQEGNDGLVETWEYLDVAANLFSKKISTSPVEQRFLIQWMTSKAMERIFTPSTQSVTEALQDGIREAHDVFVDKYDEQIYILSDPAYANEITPFLREPKGRVIDDRSRPFDYGGGWHDTFKQSVRLNNAKEYAEKQSIRMGTVEKYGPDNFRVGSRLILDSFEKDWQYPHYSDDEDLVINFELFTTGASPYIPGYKLVSTNGPRFGFKVDQKGDHYVTCEVPINKEQLTMLVDEYQSIGLDNLATEIEQVDNLTVNSLVQLISEQSIYFLPNGHKEDQELNLPPFMVSGSIGDFDRVVRNGKLHVQCTGAATFTMLSLQAIFGSESATTLSGLVLKNGTRDISAVGHTQTVFKYNDNQYILDSTPARSDSSSEEWVEVAGGANKERHGVPTPQSSPLPDKNTLDIPKPPHVELTKDEQLDGLLLSFREQAKVVFDVPNDKLLSKYLVSLAPQDPARRTYELIRQYKLDKISQEDFEQRLSYIKKCSRSSYDVRKKLHIDHYSQSFLDQLQYVAGRLKHIDRIHTIGSRLEATP